MRHGIGKDGKNHQNDRDFMCEICSKTFTRKNYLVIHMKNHAEKSIKCTVCSKMFRWNSALQAHLTAAHNMGPKEGACTCEFCGRQFQDKSNYRQHRYTHMQVKMNCNLKTIFSISHGIPALFLRSSLSTVKLVAKVSSDVIL